VKLDGIRAIAMLICIAALTWSYVAWSIADGAPLYGVMGLAGGLYGLSAVITARQ
jgi:hypothetical protein